MTVVDPAQGGIALLLLGLDLRDVRVKDTPLFVDDPAIARIFAKAHVCPLEHKMAVSHLRPPTIPGAPIIHPPPSDFGGRGV